MTETTHFPEFGGNGDKADARRVRRSFRLCVLALVVFTGMLWFSERYLRNDLAESQYAAALTLAPESSRTILRQVVKRDEATHETPTARYMEALAEREEADLILPAYEKAFTLSPEDPFLAIRYGCRLFLAGKCGEAWARFQDAAAIPSRNALADYLAASALACDDRMEDLGESVALMARTNASDDPVLFPLPVWSDSLPKQGICYHKLRREAVDECLKPLYRYSNQIIDRAKRQITVQQVQSWDSWLETLQTLGDRLLLSQDRGTIQATAGVRIQLSAIELRKNISAIETGRPIPELVEQENRLKSALALLNEFENERDARINSDAGKYKFPLYLLLISVLVLSGSYFLACLVAWFMRAGRASSWDLPHSRIGLGALWGSSAALFIFLLVVSFLQEMKRPPGASGVDVWLHGVEIAWWAVFGGMLAFGLIYPAFRLPSVAAVVHSRTRSDAMDGSVAGESVKKMAKKAKRMRRMAYCSFIRRYYGIAYGFLLCVMALWTIAYRVFISLYPWQVETLVTGLVDEEMDIVRAVLALLHPDAF